MRRFFASLSIVALLLVPVASFSDDGELQPPIGSHSVIQPHESLPILDLLLLAWSILD
jgi:hypothetical protein